MYPCVAVLIRPKNAVIAREEVRTEEGNTCYRATDKDPGRTGPDLSHAGQQLFTLNMELQTAF